MGYRRESVVSHIGEFSLRGGIIDIYPLIGDPVRIELFDTEVDSIRDFDVETQRSNQNLEHVHITTASDYIITDEVLKQTKRNVQAAYEETRPKIDKAVRNDLKETLESYQLFESDFFDHQVLRRLVAFMYKQPATLIDYFKNKNIEVRFIEFMDVGNDNGWNFNKVVTKEEMLNMIEQHFEISPVTPKYYGEVAKYFRHKDNDAQFGLITSVSESFCSTCTRARLSSDGKFYGCLFASSEGFDVKALIRSGATDDDLKAQFKRLWSIRNDQYSDKRTMQTIENNRKKKINMNYIGG